MGNIYLKKYPPEIEKLIEEEIETQREEDRDDERWKNVSDKKYRKYAIDNLIGNYIIKTN